jgi:hypothetical protein
VFEVRTVHPGMFVYGRRGAYIGKIEAANDECVRVREEVPDGRVFYIPRSALVAMLPGGEVFIDHSRAELETSGWLRPPHADPPEQLPRHGPR